MNDFTKEELQWILSSVNITIHESLTSSIGQPIANKIQSMIDNYCEHSESIMDRDGGISLACKSCWETTLDV